jgi:hypothetical protein
MWQGVMKAWNTIQAGIEQQDPHTWSEIIRLLTNEVGTQWGTEPRSNTKLWMEKKIKSLKNIAREDGTAWKSFAEQPAIRRSITAPALYTRFLSSIPWVFQPATPHTLGQWVAGKEENDTIQSIYHITRIDPLEATKYNKTASEQLLLIEPQCSLPQSHLREVRVVIYGGTRRQVMDFNPTLPPEEEQTAWLWGEDWISHLEWDLKDWQWRRIGIFAETSILN